MDSYDHDQKIESATRRRAPRKVVSCQQGEAYAAFIKAELEGEEARRVEANSRSFRAITASGAQYGLAVAAFAFIRGGDFVPAALAGAFYGASIVVYLVAVIFALMGARSHKADVADAEALRTRLADHWADDNTHALKSVADFRLRSIVRLRDSNNKKLKWLDTSMALQVVAVVLLTVAVIITAL